MKTKFFALAILGVLFIVVMSSFTPQVEGQKMGAAWEIPADYKAKVNTFADDESLINVGKMLYMKQCRSCHGNAGLGDGPKARGLKTFPGKFNDAKFQEHTDGELYFMSIIGRDEMPNFEAKIPDDEDRWAVVMYIRSLK